MLTILSELERSDEYKILNADGFSMEMQTQDNDRINSSINAQKKIVQVGFDIKQGAKQLRSIYIENE